MRIFNHGFFIRHLLRFVCAAFLGCVSLTSVYAGSFYVPMIKRFADGTVVVQPSTASLFRDIPGHAPSTYADQWLLSKTGDVLLGPSNTPVAVTHTASLPKAAVGRALGKKLLAAVPVVGTVVTLINLYPEFAGMLPGHVTVKDGQLEIMRETNYGGCLAQQGFVSVASCSTYGAGFCGAGKWTDPNTGGIFNQCGIPTTGVELKTAPYSPEQLGKDIAQATGWPATDTLEAQKIKDSIGKLYDDGLISDAEFKRSVTGPSKIPAPPTTTTIQNPDGTTSTKSVSNETRITYQGDRISTETVITNTTINNTTNITEENSVESTPTPDPTECDGAIGCMKPGQAPDIARDPASDRPFTYSPISFAENVACPPDIALNIFGQQYAVPWTRVCDMAAAIRGVVLVLGGMMAAFVLADSFRVS